MRTLASTRLTHHWYVPYAPYPLIRACAPTRLYPFSCLLTNTVVSVAPPAKKFRIFSFRPDTPFLGKFGPKNQNCKFELKFGTCTNLNKHNSMVVFSFSIFDRKCSFGEGGGTNLVQKIKITSLSWNLVPGLIQICTIHWRYWLYLFLTRNTLFRQI